MKNIGTEVWKGIKYDLFYNEDNQSATAIPISGYEGEDGMRFEVIVETEEEALKSILEKIRTSD